MKKRCLVVTGGGDCPGLNAVIRAIVKRASQENDWEIVGSIDCVEERSSVLQIRVDPLRGPSRTKTAIG